MLCKKTSAEGDPQSNGAAESSVNVVSQLRAVKLAWTGDVVQETSAEGDPQSNGAGRKFSKCRVHSSER